MVLSNLTMRNLLKKTIEHLNGMLLNNKKTHVDHFVCKQERDTSRSKINFDNALAKNFLESTTGEDLNMIQSLVVDAARIVVSLSGNKVEDKG
ncbi:hypothetical protein GQ457_02G028930 [Hibiscus cannabinus]